MKKVKFQCQDVCEVKDGTIVSAYLLAGDNRVSLIYVPEAHGINADFITMARYCDKSNLYYTPKSEAEFFINNDGGDFSKKFDKFVKKLIK